MSSARRRSAGLPTRGGHSRRWPRTACPCSRCSPRSASSRTARRAVEPLREFLEKLELTAPRIDVYGNADAAIYRGEPDAIRHRLAEHPAAPVRFGDQVEAMYADGVRTFIEVGAGSALTGLIG